MCINKSILVSSIKHVRMRERDIEKDTETDEQREHETDRWSVRTLQKLNLYKRQEVVKFDEITSWFCYETKELGRIIVT